jgi:hypothetical protein
MTTSSLYERHTTRNAVDDNNKILTDDIQQEELKRITKRDSKNERRLKFRQCFERNHVMMVSKKNCVEK